jgi:hypothetical protein
MTLRDFLLELLIAVEAREYRRVLAAEDHDNVQSMTRRLAHLIECRSAEQVARLDISRGLHQRRGRPTPHVPTIR